MRKPPELWTESLAVVERRRYPAVVDEIFAGNSRRQLDSKLGTALKGVPVAILERIRNGVEH
jgi:hypothetical protein